MIPDVPCHCYDEPAYKETGYSDLGPQTAHITSLPWCKVVSGPGLSQGVTGILSTVRTWERVMSKVAFKGIPYTCTCS